MRVNIEWADEYYKKKELTKKAEEVWKERGEKGEQTKNGKNENTKVSFRKRQVYYAP